MSRPRHRPKFVCFIGFPLEHDQMISLSPIRGQTDDWIICLQVVKVYEAKIGPGYYIKRISLSKWQIRGSKNVKIFMQFLICCSLQIKDFTHMKITQSLLVKIFPYWVTEVAKNGCNLWENVIFGYFSNPISTFFANKFQLSFIPVKSLIYKLQHIKNGNKILLILTP